MRPTATELRSLGISHSSRVAAAPRLGQDLYCFQIPIRSISV